ncbi:MAG: hypothetical protein A3A98_03035 [Candidatus Staskawiczbacteria bacterium RIFCSPLOWO2_01_FULL_40_39]|uniref:Uncharacterized protein n=1 Tax=Candidatus Staskawiczbacteria bacterium RIFCSPHIGHO2_01_FULL_39_25 TaxID=1802202 RepID=A0A1G2HPX3_9BACT|nr:MAG: hypothetical protein A2730_01500 [Candidatus Staskawiczbacteria bacterium RIFCSPHIGHO2_01_FULL_39_25]OGZ73862.1 MAG: hypothetical protein A3A98_03035 [Candidatus Staskawiczbacteria bacterium RIFCSPLOWO2_01_FULL_40_39]OGZ75899.1 MAG: hypothetical protein A3I87_00065 [Candidatus Staskawiczbacteria bacterium RIFCSPLOWO2_02_FULL_39_8]
METEIEKENNIFFSRVPLPLSVAIVAMAAFLAVIFVYRLLLPKNVVVEPDVLDQGQEKNVGLGSALYEGAKNPIENKMPETNVPNAMENVYKNPFQ